jgi:hypothetical protein
MSSPYLALPLGTEAKQRSRSVARAHEGFVAHGRVSEAVRRVVLESWQRSRASGVDPDGVLPPVDLTDDELEAYRDAHQLASVMPVIRHDDPEVWAAALPGHPAGSAEHSLALIRLAALDEEFGAR